MKKVIIIASLFFAGIVISQAQTECDTLKWKSLKSYYLYIDGGQFYRFGHLDSAIINVDTLSAFYLGSQIVNISNDTFFANEGFAIAFTYDFYADTGMVASTGWQSINYPFRMDYFPNDTLRSTSVETEFDLAFMINQLKEVQGVELEEVSYWQVITGIFYTAKDGYYSDSVFYAGSDTSTFYVVRTPVNIVETDYNASLQTIFPNPARSQFTVTHTENASLQLYNMVGQEVLHTQSTDENTIINVSTLPQGLYMLKVVKDGAVKMYKVVVSG